MCVYCLIHDPSCTHLEYFLREIGMGPEQQLFFVELYFKYLVSIDFVPRPLRPVFLRQTCCFPRKKCLLDRPNYLNMVMFLF